MKKYILPVIVLFAVIAGVKAQDVKVTSVFDSTKIVIGDQIRFTITVDKPAGMSLSIPVLKDTIVKYIDIVSGPKRDSTSTEPGRTRLIYKYLVTSFDSGRYEVRPMFAEAKTASGIKRYYSDYSLLEVNRVRITPPDTTAKIFDIVAPYRAPVTFGEIVPWLLGTALVAVLGFLLYRFIKNRKKSEPGYQEFIPVDPAHIIAFRELEYLKADQLWQRGETKKYYTRLTEILRQYLDNRFGISSLELTTEETLEALLKSGFKRDGNYNTLKSVLNGADLVKFAKYNPVADENEAHYQSSWNFVNDTKVSEPIPVTDTAPEAGKEVRS